MTAKIPVISAELVTLCETLKKEGKRISSIERGKGDVNWVLHVWWDEEPELGVTKSDGDSGVVKPLRP